MSDAKLTPPSLSLPQQLFFNRLSQCGHSRARDPRPLLRIMTETPSCSAVFQHVPPHASTAAVLDLLVILHGALSFLNLKTTSLFNLDICCFIVLYFFSKHYLGHLIECVFKKKNHVLKMYGKPAHYNGDFLNISDVYFYLH